jgi:hypothetical protein
MNKKDIAMYILGGIITVCFFAVLALLVFKPMPQENKDVLYLVIGALIGFEGSVVTYFYGSSAGSSKKDDTISNIATDKGFYQPTFTAPK